MERGEVRWVELPNEGGREQRGNRPAIIMQVADFSRLPTVLAVPLTSQMIALRFPGTVRIEPTNKNGLKTASVALVFQLRACDVQRIGGELGKLDLGDLQAVEAEVRSLLGLN